MGSPKLIKTEAANDQDIAIALGLAGHSRHPLSRALVRDTQRLPVSFDTVSEVPGGGLQAISGHSVYRLGSAAFACATGDLPSSDNSPLSEVVLAKDGATLVRFYFDDTLRPGASDTVRQLDASDLGTLIVSGDRQSVVDNTARKLGIDTAMGGLTPKQKVDECQRLNAGGHRVLMVGDGINDAPALAAAHVSMAPSTASDIGRQAADLVFFNERLDAVPEAISVAKNAARLIRQNFVLAIGYNVLAVPVAIAGLATPLIAAVAMSTSSIIVVVNALRLNTLETRRNSSPDVATVAIRPEVKTA
jgi:Cu2+-exporting ATPase